ncbi:MAG: helix-turn-helix domain-containing protein [Phycisphaeraceae bacterium]|nr:helix-turn-helix domain-containing protein [Phycisphaeraceae bacterium]
MPVQWDHLGLRINRVNRQLCEPGWHLGGPVWNLRLHDFDLWMVFEGKGSMMMDGQRMTLHPGVCLWIRPGHRYEAEQDTDNRLGINAIHFILLGEGGTVYHDQRSFELANLGTLPPVVFELVDVNFADTVMRRVVELVNQEGDAQRQPQSAATSLFKGLLMDIDAQITHAAGSSLGGTQRHHRQLVMAAAARLAQSPGDAPSIEQLARQAGYTPDHFTRVFRQQTGLTPQAYLVRARINRACHLLIESSLPIGRIADMLGYRDPYFFSRQFHEKVGRSPRQYRRLGSAFDAS